MALKVESKRFFRHRGINDLSEIKRIEDDHVKSLINFDIRPQAEGRSSLKIRGGTLKDTMSTNLTGGTQVQGIAFAEFTGGDETIFVYNTNYYRLAATPTDIGGVLVAPDTMHDFVTFQDVLIIGAASTALREVASAGAVAAVAGTPTPPQAKYLHVWHNILFAVTDNSRTLHWTEINDRTDWPVTNQQDFDHGEITGINSLGDTFYIFFKNKIMSLTGFTPSGASADFVFDEFADVGCISHHGIVSNGSTLFFPARDAIYAIGSLGATDAIIGGSSLVKLSDNKIRTKYEGVDLSRDIIHGIHDAQNHKVRWCVRDQGESVNDEEIWFDYHDQVLGFGITTGRNISCYALGKDTNAKYIVKYGDSRTDANGGIIYVFSDSAANDDGVLITGTIETKAYDFDLPENPKKFHSIEILMKGNSSNTPLRVSYGVGEFPAFSNTKTLTTKQLNLWGTFKWGTDAWSSDEFNKYPIALRKIGEALNIKMVTDTLNKGPEIAGWSINGSLLKNKMKTDI